MYNSYRCQDGQGRNYHKSLHGLEKQTKRIRQERRNL